VVHGDKVPMVPGFGQQPRFIVTIQPSGAVFNLPAAITLPNVDGLKPRQVTEMYSFDHDIGSFVAIGTGTVSDDGQVIRSNPGVGVLKAGWHCGGDPAANGTAADCGDCKICQGNNCAADASQNGSNQRDSSSCCFNGEKLPNVAPSYAVLIEKCPSRQQNPTLRHEIDGCSNSPDDPMRVTNPITLLARAPTAFGASEPGGVPSGSPPGRDLPCNWHDVCYQTCGTTMNSRTQDGCDRDLQTRAHIICNTAYELPPPYPSSDPRFQEYLDERQECHGYADYYYNVLSGVGGPFYRGRQKEYCNCCRQ